MYVVMLLLIRFHISKLKMLLSSSLIGQAHDPVICEELEDITAGIWLINVKLQVGSSK